MCLDYLKKMPVFEKDWIRGYKVIRRNGNSLFRTPFSFKLGAMNIDYPTRKKIWSFTEQEQYPRGFHFFFKKKDALVWVTGNRVLVEIIIKPEWLLAYGIQEIGQGKIHAPIGVCNKLYINDKAYVKEFKKLCA